LLRTATPDFSCPIMTLSAGLKPSGCSFRTPRCRCDSVPVLTPGLMNCPGMGQQTTWCAFISTPGQICSTESGISAEKHTIVWTCQATRSSLEYPTCTPIVSMRQDKYMTYKLVLLRHGESEWNAKNLFTGWVDVHLSEKGREEASRGGELLTAEGIRPDVVHTSLLRRAITTANLALDKADLHWIPVKRNWRLNERHYGALQGKDKKQTLEQYGEEQFMEWRRSYDTPPPEIELGSEFSQDADPRYADLGDEMPRTECLKDVLERALPYWENEIIPDLK